MASMKNGGIKRVAIACQSRGSHAAFTAGVLKWLLFEKQNDFEVKALSGTSGGAVCAFLAWYALLKKDNEQATRLLESFWEKDNSARSLEERFVNESLVWSNWWTQSTVGVPESNPYRVPYYYLPPFHSPDYWQDRLESTLEGKLEEKIEDRVKPSDSPVMLFVGAVNALTGEFRVFGSHKLDGNRGGFVLNNSPYDGLSTEAAVASAAVPFLFKAVHTGKAAYWNDSQEPPACLAEGVYWDGLYSQNPPMRDLPDANPDEIWVVQINPEEIEEESKTTANIWDRRNELAGNISLNQELYFIRKFNEQIRQTKELVERLKELDGPVEENLP
jgi:NTE family protein